MTRTRGKDPGKKKPDPATEAFAAGLKLVWANPALAAIDFELCREEECRAAPEDGLVLVNSNGYLHAHATRLAEPAEWAWAIAHALLHLGFGHVPGAPGEREQPDRFDLAARCVVVNRFLLTFPVGRTPTTCPPPTPRATRIGSRPAGARTASRPPTSTAVRQAARPTSASCRGTAGPASPWTGNSPSRAR